MNTTFSLHLLRAFLAVVDTGSFTAAARALHSTQSTVSQQVLRLEETASQVLLDRSRRGVRPTEAGEQLLGYARRMLMLNDEAAAALSGASVRPAMRLGLPEDFASMRVTPLLSRFMRSHGGMKLEVTSGLSRDLQRAYDTGELDLVMVKQKPGATVGVMSWPEPLCWLDSADHPAFEMDPLPLAAFPPNGLYRADMISALDAIGRRWRLAYTSSSLASIQSAVADGLGVSLLPARTALPGHRVLTPDSGLPKAGMMEIAIHHRADAADHIRQLAALLAEAVEA
ncbi:LysR substrate-binding domain-containing protein [Arvimicrobium flavum]|uniref:LysR substrate-binding domain-containing protein n=1 Tax=Arvimicrobium flavum TaxID=3393320 RepID=UPI00237A7129|nr:LysR substrate-binding domain-containing protein [Mesorhizobium shangrilense]